MATTNLRRTQSTPTDNNLYTFSCWVKRGNLGGVQALLGSFTNSTNRGQLEFNSSNQLNYYENLSGSTSAQVTTTQVFRDTSAWYHIVLNVDLDQTTASDRIKMYVNGTQITSFGTTTYPSQGATSVIANCTASNGLLVGGSTSDNSTFYNIDGSMSHVHFIDGTAYDATAFGEYDANGVWKIKTSPSVTYGNNGFFILKDGNSVTDQSGNSNNFTVGGGTLTNTEDNPSNVFATFNPLTNDGGGGAKTYSLGNTKVAETGDSWTSAHTTLGTTSGKYYYEAKVTYTNNNEAYIGASSEQAIFDKVNASHYLGQTTGSVGYYTGNGSYYKGAGAVGYGSAVSSGDIVGVALDLDNNYIYFSINGTWQNSGDPESGATGTGGISLPSGMTTGDFKFLSVSPNESYLEANFGNGYFGTTAVSSAQNPDDGIGIFEYDVPTGYRALCTKSINAEEYD